MSPTGVPLVTIVDLYSTPIAPPLGSIDTPLSNHLISPATPVSSLFFHSVALFGTLGTPVVPPVTPLPRILSPPSRLPCLVFLEPLAPCCVASCLFGPLVLVHVTLSCTLLWRCSSQSFATSHGLLGSSPTLCPSASPRPLTCIYTAGHPTLQSTSAIAGIITPLEILCLLEV